MNEDTIGKKVIRGLSGCKGLVEGPVLVIDRKQVQVQPQKITSDQVQVHIDRYKKAVEELTGEMQFVSQSLDKETRNILDTQVQMINDPDIAIRVSEYVSRDLFSVEYAVFLTFDRFIERLQESGSELFRQRITDLEFIRDRLISTIRKDESQTEVEKGAILIVREISPTDLVRYHEKGVAGLVMDKGGITSHATIISQSLGLPCIVSAKNAVKMARDAKFALMDGEKGELTLDPTASQVRTFSEQRQAFLKSELALSNEEHHNQTRDGTPFNLRANIEFRSELALAEKYHADGIGLLRTEALLYGGLTLKSEKEQDLFYEDILSQTNGIVVIRLFDVGGDKLNVHAPDEDNPFLGWRGIRMLLDEEEMFHTQLSSILRLSGRYPGRVNILVPMISTMSEIRAVRKALNVVTDALREQQVTVDTDLKLGMMIETPASALMADSFAKEVDFFSIGTNDLTQYTLAVDRSNERICDLYQHHDPSIWKLIKMTVDAANKHDIPVSVCGELAGEGPGAACLLGLGITDLSMSAAFIPKVRKVLNVLTIGQMKELSGLVLSCSSPDEVKNLFNGLELKDKNK